MQKGISTAVFAILLGFSGASLAQAQYYTTPTQPMVPYYSSSCPTLSYNLVRGSSDYRTQGQVSQLQQFLAARGYYQAVTGYFGPVTASNVARFQAEQGIYPATGGVGPITRAAIARTCGGGQQGSTFYLNTPFTLYVGQTAKLYQGQLDFTLSQINTSPYTSPYGSQWSYPQPTSARITLGQSCPQGLYCATLWYPTQSFDLGVGQGVTWQGYTVILNSLSASTATFTVTYGGTTQTTTVSVASPLQGQTVARGTQLPILWTVNNAPTNSSVVAELYTVQGSKVGTIAIQSNVGAGSFSWNVPVGGTVCTLQYPNGLCGQNLSGQYFVKVSVVSGSGFDSNPTTYGSANSGTFTIY